MNHEKIAVLTDSCADIPQSMIDRYHLFVLPLRITFRDRSYTDGVDITPEEVYRRLPQEIPKTSLPSPESVLALFDRIRDAGYQKVFAIIFSSGLSGTYNLVRFTAENYKDLEIYPVDTLSGSLGTGAVVLRTAQLIEEGRSFNAIKQLLPRLVAGSHVFFSLDTLEYLQKGGRIGKITAVAGTLLNVKPIITFSDDGQLVNVAKTRGRKKSIQKLVELAAGFCEPGKRCIIMVAGGGCPDEVAEVRALYTSQVSDHLDVFEGEIDSTLGVHTGPHLLGAGILVLDDDC